MEQHFELMGVAYQHIQWILFKVCQHVGGLSSTICLLFLMFNGEFEQFLLLDEAVDCKVVIVIVSRSDERTETLI